MEWRRVFQVEKIAARRSLIRQFCGEMQRLTRCVWIVVAIAGAGPKGGVAPEERTWKQVRYQFEATNPTLRAGHIGIDEAKAQETTAYLRPNPDMTSTIDQIDPFT